MSLPKSGSLTWKLWRWAKSRYFCHCPVALSPATSAISEGDDRVDAPGVGAHHVLEPPDDLVLGLEGQVARAEPVGQEQVHPHERGRRSAPKVRPRPTFTRKRVVEDAAEPNRGEPHLVGPEHREGAQREEPDDEDDDDQADPEAARQTAHARARDAGRPSRAAHGPSLGRGSRPARRRTRTRRAAAGSADPLGNASPAGRSPERASSAQASHGASVGATTKRTRWPWHAAAHPEVEGAPRARRRRGARRARRATPCRRCWRARRRVPAPSVRMRLRSASTIVTARSAGAVGDLGAADGRAAHAALVEGEAGRPRPRRRRSASRAASA